LFGQIPFAGPVCVCRVLLFSNKGLDGHVSTIKEESFIHGFDLHSLDLSSSVGRDFRFLVVEFVAKWLRRQ
jgi:hypothetical protein